MHQLTFQQVRLVAEYFRCERNKLAAYKIVYPGADAISALGSAYLAFMHPLVVNEIARWENQKLKGLRMSPDDFHAEIHRLADADVREIMGYWTGACRHCYGQGFAYQRTLNEFNNDCRKHIADRKALASKGFGRPDPLGLEFDMQGGAGFTPKKPPHPDCPECFGDGEMYEKFHDTRNLSPAAAKLFDGVKRTKDGIEIKIRNRDKHLEMAGRAIGVLGTRPIDDGEDKTEVRIVVKGGLPQRPDAAIVPPAGSDALAPGVLTDDAMPLAGPGNDPANSGLDGSAGVQAASDGSHMGGLDDAAGHSD